MRLTKPMAISVMLTVLLLGAWTHAQPGTSYPAVTAPPDSFFQMVREPDREAARAFYKKYIDVEGMPVVASAEVADLALQRTYDIVTHMLAGRPDILQSMVSQGMYLIVIGKDQVYTDMPENRNARNPDYLNERVRGTGGMPTSFGEENLLSLPIDRYDDESIAVHEFCHTIDSTLGRIDTTWRQRKNAAYRNALDKGLFKDTYAGSNSAEYWAEIAQAYFDCNRINNWNHGPIGTREQLKVYDPQGYELVRTAFNLSPGQDWRYSWLQPLPRVENPPARFNVDPYYTKFTWAREFTVLGREAANEALLKANDTIRKMFAYRHDILKALMADGVKLVVLGPDEKISDLPEYKKWDVNGLDPLARFLDYMPQTKLLVADHTNVLASPLDPLAGECQVIRVFAKAIYQVTGTRPVDPNWDTRRRDVQQYELRVQRMDVRFDEKLKTIYDAAMTKGQWKGTSAIQDRVEYWAQGVLAYFNAVGTGATPTDADHPITTREALKEYDPNLFALVDETMAYKGRVDWRYYPQPPASPQYRFGPPRKVEGYYKGQITPHWLADNTSFWYRNDLTGNTKEFILVNAEQGTRQPAFDHQKLAAALSKAGGTEYRPDQLPFDSIEFADGAKSIRFTVDQTVWDCNLASYTCAKTDAAPSESPTGQDQERRFRRRGQGPGRERNPSPDSPDGKWTAFIKDNNVFIRPQDANDETPLSTDGTEGNAYSVLSWAPDSTVLVAWRVEPGEHKEVYLIRSSPSGGGRATLETRPYALPGDKFPKYELNIFEVADRKQLKPQVDRFEHEWETPRLHWSLDGRRFAYQQVDRGHQRLRLIEVDAHTGEVRTLLEEKTETFIWTAHTENLRLELVNWLDKTDEIIYVSERDGWRHLYLVDAAKDGACSQITKGEWVIRGIDLIDEDTRQIWFNAGGKNPDQDPYFLHYYRVNFDGSGLVALTEGDGNHSVQFSPDRRYLIDTYSRVDMPPVHELRRASDGKLICLLEQADVSELTAKGMTTPEVFVAKGRDGKTDIWGIICRPSNLDPSRKCPVLEQIYAGPQDSYVPKSFSPTSRFTSLTNLGFIVVQIDGMGTANRSKAFHDVCWHNLKDAGFPDRIPWHQAAAKKYPYYDISRVGIYGGSAGGQNAAGALLFHPEFYKAAVAICGCHDNRMDKASWNEQWMGYPVGPCYSECSNIDNAAKLKGYLFLIVGEMDTNVPPESTMRFVDALIRADKDFDLLVVPGANHGAPSKVTQRRQQDFFIRHLLGTEPPNHNVVDPNQASPESR